MTSLFDVWSTDTERPPESASTSVSASDPLPSWVWPVTLGGIVLVVAVGFWGYWLVAKERLKEAERERKALESAADRLREKMELPSLVDFNRVLLDQYHGIATDQASKAYRSSRFAMHVGLGILVVAFFAGWQLNAQGDRLFVGTVAAVGTAFTAYLSRTYMQTYERALQQLNQYFNQPVLNGYFLTAERIAGSLPEDRRAEVLERVVDDVLESGKVMHHNATGASKPEQANPPKRARRRRAAQGEATIPNQQTQ
ncbi:eukaryotic translation initiation factor 3 subunit E [Streptomyces sp. NBC_01230]|uniref:hypothetical protein n=1 Tax=Streptomyces sp. NBC_01230 TaxID=2903784 RepID=UPI002E104125|nr:eukaryotic translation initiation factor 3 subunit E [Streptomyces sp. NBC_01230]